MFSSEIMAQLSRPTISHVFVSSARTSLNSCTHSSFRGAHLACITSLCRTVSGRSSFGSQEDKRSRISPGIAACGIIASVDATGTHSSVTILAIRFPNTLASADPQLSPVKARLM